MGHKAQKKDKDNRSRLQRIATSMRDFAKTYNNHKMCPLNHDLLRVLYPGDMVKDKPRALRRKRRAYDAFRKAHPEFGLPPLIPRKGKDGNIIAVPEGVLEQIDEFRIDTEKAEKAKGIIVTSAQFGAVLNKPVFDALKRYAEHLGYALIVMPIKYGPVRTVYQREIDKRVLTSTFDAALKGHMIFEDLTLAKGMLTLNVLRLRPTLTRFLTDPICERGGNASQIFAAPKIELETRPRLGHRHPKMIMTTGAVTHPSYNVDNLGQQDRTGEIAQAEHNFAAIIVEFSGKQKKVLHFRQLLTTKTGEFYDIDPVRGGGLFVTPRSIEHRPDDVNAVVLGDWHTGKTHPRVRTVTFEYMLPKLNPDHVVQHDLFDGDSISHWEDRQASRRAYKGERQIDSLRKELDALIEELKWMGKSLPDALLHVVASNHNEFLRKCIDELRWVKDNENLRIGAKLFTVIQDDLEARAPARHDILPVDPVNWWIEAHELSHVRTHDRRSQLILPEGPGKKILLSLHGDIGPHGRRAGSLKAFRKWNKWIIIGHRHSPGILGPVWCVGTSTHLTEHYVDGPATSWSNTHAVVYANGQRQLISIVDGSWHGQAKRTRSKKR